MFELYQVRTATSNVNTVNRTIVRSIECSIKSFKTSRKNGIVKNLKLVLEDHKLLLIWS